MELSTHHARKETNELRYVLRLEGATLLKISCWNEPSLRGAVFWRKAMALEQKVSQVKTVVDEVWLGPTWGGKGGWWDEGKTGHGKVLVITGVEQRDREGGVRQRWPPLLGVSRTFP